MWIDGHLDLAYLALGGRDLRRPCDAASGGCVSLPDLADGRVELACATIYTAPDPSEPTAAWTYDSPEDVAGAVAAGQAQMQVYRTLESQGLVRIVRSAAELETPRDAAGPLSIVLLMEGADPIATPEDVPAWFDQGLRLVGLTWAEGTRYAGGNARPGPLTPLGIELVAALDEAGIGHDASHLADEALDGLLERARGPVLATHSNCRALVEPPSQRLLRDDQIAAIGARGGVVGLNLYTGFLAAERRATVADCAEHVQRIASIMGHRRGVALGSDMDGGFGTASLPADLDHPRKLGGLCERLAGDGWSDDDLEAFRRGNWLRMLGRVLS